MKANELLAELAHWRLRIEHLGAKEARKGAANRIRQLERLIDEKNQPNA
jgi:hypothetical protein